ncbi:MAG: GntR family transcriptional regulator [Myxococcales bacterium]|nr:GntR family transcriptional regulator [Myxococcales bacterium]
METPDETKREDDTGSFQVEPPVRQRVADHVFETLARAIFNKELKPGEPLPTQRELAKRFKISALVVRQAIHRLEDMGLVRVRQGSTTIIHDPAESDDIRLMKLQMELADPAENLASDVFENQVLFLLPMLVLAERRITDEQLAVLDYIVDSVDREDATAEDGKRFRTEYWRQISKATHNSMFQQQVRWWAVMVQSLEAQGRDFGAPSGQVMVQFYRTLNQRLGEGSGAVEHYLSSFRPLFEWMDRQRGNTPRAERNAQRAERNEASEEDAG